MTLLELQNIKKYFPIKKQFIGTQKGYVKAVDGVSLSVFKNEHLGLVGESGCGKTTLGRVAMRLLPPDKGTVSLCGQDITVISPRKMKELRKDVQMVFQDPFTSLDPRFTVSNLLGEAMIFEKIKKPQKEERMRNLLSAVKLPEDILERFPYEFSGGERQRIAIARALCMNPKLLILDEAVSSLDVLVQEDILDLLKQLRNDFETTYLFISHNLRVIRKLCKKVAVMFKGKIVELGPCEEVYNNPLHLYTKQLLSAAVNYKVKKDKEEFLGDLSGKLIHKGGQHFVLE